jgi:hypothetical protein
MDIKYSWSPQNSETRLTLEEIRNPKPNNTVQRVFQSFLGQTLTRRRFMTPQLLFLCSDRVGMLPVIKKTLSFSSGGLGVDEMGGFAVAWDVD